jgi:hypothetical protein
VSERPAEFYKAFEVAGDLSEAVERLESSLDGMGLLVADDLAPRAAPFGGDGGDDALLGPTS